MVADYLELDEAREHLGLGNASEWDVKLQAVITGVSRWIDDYCRRHFWQEEAARLFDSCDGRLVRLDVFNDLVSVDEVATDIDRDGTYADVWDPAEFQLLPAQPRPGRPYTRVRAVGRRFPVPAGRVGLVRVTGMWGWPEVPVQVSQAALIQTARVFKRKDAPEGIIGFDQFGHTRVAAKPDPDVQHLLDPLIHPGAIAVT